MSDNAGLPTSLDKLRISRHFSDMENEKLSDYAGDYEDFDKEFHNFITLMCGNCGKTWKHEIDCGDRTCPRCNARRRARIFSRYSSVIGHMRHPIFITLTVKRCLLRAYNVKQLRAAFTRLRHRHNEKKFVWRASGGLYQVEVGSIHEDESCNMHLHIIADSPYMSQNALSKAWKECTRGQGWIVDIRKCRDSKQALKYMTKHMCKKIGDYEYAELINRQLKGSRLVQGFGYLSKMGLCARDSVCPFCGAVNSIISVYEPLWNDVADGVSDTYAF